MVVVVSSVLIGWLVGDEYSRASASQRAQVTGMAGTHIWQAVAQASRHRKVVTVVVVM